MKLTVAAPLLLFCFASSTSFAFSPTFSPLHHTAFLQRTPTSTRAYLPKALSQVKRPTRLSASSKEGDEEEDDDLEDLSEDLKWGSALSSLRARMAEQNAGIVGESGALFRLMSSMTPSQVITDFLSSAQPLVINAMSDAVGSLIGGMGTNPAMGVDVIAKVKGEKLGALCFQLQMTGYMFRNAEYVLALKEVRSGAALGAKRRVRRVWVWVR